MEDPNFDNFSDFDKTIWVKACNLTWKTPKPLSEKCRQISANYDDGGGCNAFCKAQWPGMLPNKGYSLEGRCAPEWETSNNKLFPDTDWKKFCELPPGNKPWGTWIGDPSCCACTRQPQNCVACMPPNYKNCTEYCTAQDNGYSHGVCISGSSTDPGNCCVCNSVFTDPPAPTPQPQCNHPENLTETKDCTTVPLSECTSYYQRWDDYGFVPIQCSFNPNGKCYMNAGVSGDWDHRCGIMNSKCADKDLEFVGINFPIEFNVINNGGCPSRFHTEKKPCTNYYERDWHTNIPVSCITGPGGTCIRANVDDKCNPIQNHIPTPPPTPPITCNYPQNMTFVSACEDIIDTCNNCNNKYWTRDQYGIPYQCSKPDSCTQILSNGCRSINIEQQPQPCNNFSESTKKCSSIGTDPAITNAWCNNNCNNDPPYCPPSDCSCSSKNTYICIEGPSGTCMPDLDGGMCIDPNNAEGKGNCQLYAPSFRKQCTSIPKDKLKVPSDMILTDCASIDGNVDEGWCNKFYERDPYTLIPYQCSAIERAGRCTRGTTALTCYQHVNDCSTIKNNNQAGCKAFYETDKSGYKYMCISGNKQHCQRGELCTSKCGIYTKDCNDLDVRSILDGCQAYYMIKDDGNGKKPIKCIDGPGPINTAKCMAGNTICQDASCITPQFSEPCESRAASVGMCPGSYYDTTEKKSYNCILVTDNDFVSVCKSVACIPPPTPPPTPNPPAPISS